MEFSVDMLLRCVLDAHGGLQRWMRVRSLTAHVALQGPFWAARGWPNVYDDAVVRIDPHQEHITFHPFTAAERSSELKVDPEMITIFGEAGRVEEQRLNPRASFPAFTDTTQWDAIQLAYFTSAAVWNYLTAPFVFTMPGVLAREIAPWDEHGEMWRRLAVTFPSTNANHNADQVFYYDDAFMQRRMDYAPDVTGRPPIAHYTYEPKRFGGFVFPTRRRVLLRDVHGVADQTFAPITVDIANVTLEMQTDAGTSADDATSVAGAAAGQLANPGVAR